MKTRRKSPAFQLVRFQFSAFNAGGAPVDLAEPRLTFQDGMINVTDNAVRQLKSLLNGGDAQTARKGLRVQIAKGGCSGLQYEMALDEHHEGDSVLEREGVQFLVDAESAAFLEGATLDFREGLTGTGFHIVNPNAARTCGCGSSFEAARPA